MSLLDPLLASFAEDPRMKRFLGQLEAAVATLQRVEQKLDLLLKR